MNSLFNPIPGGGGLFAELQRLYRHFHPGGPKSPPPPPPRLSELQKSPPGIGLKGMIFRTKVQYRKSDIFTLTEDEIVKKLQKEIVYKIKNMQNIHIPSLKSIINIFLNKCI